MPLIRSASFSLFVEILVRIALVSAFCYMETMTPFTRYIHKSDLESEYKYPRKDSYVPGGTLWAIVLSVPFCLSVIAWAVCNDCNDALEILLSWSLALGLNGVITDMIKLIAGRPRPDFFYRCFPDGVATEDLQCTGDPVDIMEGRKSFPSGHSSLSFCSLGTATMWICGRACVFSKRGGSGGRGGRAGAAAPGLLLAVAPLAGAAAVALSRTCDYHHHWQDILVGSIIGLTTAIVCYRQYYNPLSSDLSGVPYVVSNSLSKYFNGKPDVSPVKDKEMESTPLLNGKKDDKWI